MSKTACVYHSIDLDGWMSAAIVKHWFIKQKKNYINSKIFKEVDIDFGILDFLGYNYGQPIPDLSEYDKVIMCDVSFPKEEMYKLFERLDQNFIWIDHHISAMKELFGEYIPKSNVVAGLRDTKFAACELTWKYFMSNPVEKFGELEDQNPMPEIVRLLGLYDSFRHKGTDEEQKVLEFQYGARQCISNYEEAYHYLKVELNSYLPNPNNCDREENPIYRIWNNGKSIYQYLCTEAKQTYKNGFEIRFTEDFGQDSWIRKFICINKERFNPINFNIDYHKNGYDGCASFWYADGMWNFSLYNDNGEVDCSMIAKQYAGGGHRGAAGFRLNNEQFLQLISK